MKTGLVKLIIFGIIGIMRITTKDLPMIIAQGNTQDGQRWVLKKNLLIGRGEDCDIVVPNQQVSRHHAKLSRAENGVVLEDLDSKNGTFCNGVPVHDGVLLHEEDLIQIALAQQFVFVNSDVTAPLDKEIQFDPVAPILDNDEHKLKGIFVDKRSRRVWVNGIEVNPPLSALQFNLLDMLYHRSGQVASRIEIINEVWGEEDAAGVSEQALDALIRRLRDRLKETDTQHDYIVTIRGHGIRLENTDN